MHLDLGDPWCRLPGVECRSAVPAPSALCRHDGAPCAAPRKPFTFLPRQGVDCKPGRRHILHWPMSARGRKLYPPQKGSLRHVNSALLHRVHGAHLPAVHLYSPRTRWKSAGGLLQELTPLHHVSLSLGSVAIVLPCCRMVTRYRYLGYRHPPRRRPCRFVLIRRTGGGEQGPPTESRTRIISSDFSPEVNLRGRFCPVSCRPFPISDKLIKMRPKVEK